MKNKVNKWLSNSKRDYREGLDIFNQFASAEIKANFGEFLKIKEGEETVKPFDKRFPILINKISAIFTKIKLNPKAYPVLDAKTTFSGKNFSKEEILKKSEEIKTLQEEKRELESKIEELESAGEDKQDEIDELKEELEEKDEALENLQSEMEEKISKSGLKVVTYDNLPKDIKKIFDRTKEITPLMAKVHSELSKENISDEDRKKIANELCKLDDERRDIWDKIDAWSEGKEVVFEEPKEIVYSEDPVVKGMQVGKRIERLQENIQRADEAIEKHTKSGKENLVLKARERLTAYEKELKELQEAVNESK